MTPAQRNVALRILATTALSVLILTGCNSKTKATPNNFIQALNAHFIDRSECLFVDTKFPYATSDPVKTKQMNTLVKSSLLDVSYESAVHTSRFTPTTTGARYAPRFCYGHRTVTGIDSFTPPAKGASGFPETHVIYRFKMEDVPIWAKSADVQAAFPEMTAKTTGETTDKITLAQTLAGWQVPD